MGWWKWLDYEVTLPWWCYGIVCLTWFAIGFVVAEWVI